MPWYACWCQSHVCGPGIAYRGGYRIVMPPYSEPAARTLVHALNVGMQLGVGMLSATQPGDRVGVMAGNYRVAIYQSPLADFGWWWHAMEHRDGHRWRYVRLSVNPDYASPFRFHLVWAGLTVGQIPPPAARGWAGEG